MWMPDGCPSDRGVIEATVHSYGHAGLNDIEDGQIRTRADRRSVILFLLDGMETYRWKVKKAPKTKRAIQ
jgi:hypothetical protein